MLGAIVAQNNWNAHQIEIITLRMEGGMVQPHMREFNEELRLSLRPNRTGTSKPSDDGLRAALFKQCAQDARFTVYGQSSYAGV
jgi:hypothetical protein